MLACYDEHINKILLILLGSKLFVQEKMQRQKKLYQEQIIFQVFVLPLDKICCCFFLSGNCGSLFEWSYSEQNNLNQEKMVILVKSTIDWQFFCFCGHTFVFYKQPTCNASTQSKKNDKIKGISVSTINYGSMVETLIPIILSFLFH